MPNLLRRHIEVTPMLNFSYIYRTIKIYDNYPHEGEKPEKFSEVTQFSNLTNLFDR